MAQVILSLSNVSKIFGGLRAVDQVSLQVTIGERRVLIGPNGLVRLHYFIVLVGRITPRLVRFCILHETLHIYMNLIEQYLGLVEPFKFRVF